MQIYVYTKLQLNVHKTSSIYSCGTVLYSIIHICGPLCVCLFLFHTYSVWINANTFIYSNIYGSKVKIFYIQFCLICDILKDRDIHTYTLNLLNCGIKTIATNFIIICCKNFWILAMHLTKSQFKNEELFVQFTNERFLKKISIFSQSLHIQAFPHTASCKWFMYWKQNMQTKLNGVTIKI